MLSRRRAQKAPDPPRGSTCHPPASAEDVIGYLREHEITLTYDPAAGTLQAGATRTRQDHHRESKLTPGAESPGTGRRIKEPAGRPALAGARARVTSRHARKRPAMGF